MDILHTHHSEVILKLVSPASSGTQCCVQAGEVLIPSHLNKAGHGLCWEANEVQVSCPAAHGQIPQLQVNITYTCFT